MSDEGFVRLWPELRRLHRLHNYPLRRLPLELNELISARPASASLNKLLDCYLEVTGKTVPEDWHSTETLSNELRGFIGALNSPKFVVLTAGRAYMLTQQVISFAKTLACQDLRDMCPRSNRPTDAIQREIDRFESARLDDNAVEYWRGWPVRSRRGNEKWLELHGVFEHMGSQWTRELHLAVAAWFQTVRADGIPGLNEFLLFLVNRKHSSESVRDIRGATAFWRDFWGFYSEERGKTASNKVVLSDWSNHWAGFAEDVLAPAGLVAVVKESFPRPGAAYGRAHNDSHVPEAGTDSLEGLLVTVPRHFSDTKALEEIVKEVPCQLNHVRTWANAECALAMSAYRRRRKAAKNFNPRFMVGVNAPCGFETWKTDRGNPDHLHHAAATLEAYGYGTREDLPLTLLYPKPLRHTARELGLPTAGTLLPFAALLVMEDPQITSSFLETLELFDRRGRLTGYRRLDGGSYLIGYKNRKKREGQQKVKLTPVALRALRCILLLTFPIREYLRRKGDEQWRYLFLETGKGFGVPHHVKRFATFTSGACLPALKAKFEMHCGLDAKDAGRLVKLFSLKALRSTVALNVFIETHSEESMSRALGHKRFEAGLLGRYLPPALLAFFRARWVSAFQTHIVLAVTRGTGFELRASGFKSTREMELFLEANAFPRLEDTLANIVRNCEPVQDGTFFFNANRDTLQAIVSLAEGSKRVAPESSSYWGLFSRHMVEHLKSRRGLDPQVDRWLDAAQERVAEAQPC